MSPIFHEITDFRKIIECSRDFVDEYWFENLNLRGGYKADILNYVKENYLEYESLYNDIYVKGNKRYWEELSCKIEEYCEEHSIKHVNYFYHEKLVLEKIKSKNC